MTPTTTIGGRVGRNSARQIRRVRPGLAVSRSPSAWDGSDRTSMFEAFNLLKSVQRRGGETTRLERVRSPADVRAADHRADARQIQLGVPGASD